MNKNPDIVTQWVNFGLGDIVPICGIIGAIVGAYYANKNSDDRDPGAAIATLFHAVLCGFGGMFIGIVIMTLPFIAMGVAVMVGVGYGMVFLGQLADAVVNPKPEPPSAPPGKVEKIIGASFIGLWGVSVIFTLSIVVIWLYRTYS